MKKMILTSILSAALLMHGCNDKILDPLSITPDYVLIDGDTIKTRDDKVKKDKFKGHPDHKNYVITGDTIVTFKAPKKNKPSKLPNLAALESPDRKGKKFRMVVFGGSLAAGVRDGGLFNEGMETSFGSLLSNQMGIDFKNPLFDAADYNGYGRKGITTFNPTKGPIPKLKNVVNNTGIDGELKDANGDAVLKKAKGEFDNYAFPYSSFVRFGESRGGLTEGELPQLSKRLNRPYLNGEIKNGKTFDFFMMEIPEIDMGIFPDPNKWIEMYKTFKEFDILIDPNKFGYNGTNPTEDYPNFFKKMERVKAKGIVILSPDQSFLAFNLQNYKNELVKIIDKYQLKGLYSGIDYFLTTNEIKTNMPKVWGTSGMDSTISPTVNINHKPGVSRSNPISDFRNNILNLTSEQKLQILNKSKQNTMAKLAIEKIGYPVLDLNVLYESIQSGKYVSLDGTLVSPQWPGGNFFSSDGIHPSAFGQAVITNEIIKVLNAHYKMEIPDLNTRDYLK